MSRYSVQAVIIEQGKEVDEVVLTLNRKVDSLDRDAVLSAFVGFGFFKDEATKENKAEDFSKE